MNGKVKLVVPHETNEELSIIYILVDDNIGALYDNITVRNMEYYITLCINNTYKLDGYIDDLHRMSENFSYLIKAVISIRDKIINIDDIVTINKITLGYNITK